MYLAVCLSTSVALGLAVWGWWGQYTEAGQRHYDEMAGMIPLAAWYVGLLLLAVSALWWIWILFFRQIPE